MLARPRDLHRPDSDGGRRPHPRVRGATGYNAGPDGTSCVDIDECRSQRRGPVPGVGRVREHERRLHLHLSRGQRAPHATTFLASTSTSASRARTAATRALHASTRARLRVRRPARPATTGLDFHWRLQRRQRVRRRDQSVPRHGRVPQPSRFLRLPGGVPDGRPPTPRCVDPDQCEIDGVGGTSANETPIAGTRLAHQVHLRVHVGNRRHCAGELRQRPDPGGLRRDRLGRPHPDVRSGLSPRLLVVPSAPDADSGRLRERATQRVRAQPRHRPRGRDRLRRGRERQRLQLRASHEQHRHLLGQQRLWAGAAHARRSVRHAGSGRPQRVRSARGPHHRLLGTQRPWPEQGQLGRHVPLARARGRARLRRHRRSPRSSAGVW